MSGGFDREALNGVLRAIRRWLYRVLDPLDRLFLKINGLGDYPPISLRRHVSCLGFIDGSGREHYAYLRLLAGLRNGQRVLDLACGCGLLELAMAKGGWQGELVGVDIHKPSVDWCRRRLEPRLPGHSFVHADVYNAAYWRRGRLQLDEWLESFEPGRFHQVVAKSLFTHMLPDELATYLSAIRGWLEPGGRALLTFFLLNEEQRRLQAERGGGIAFQRAAPDSPHAVLRPEAPTAAVAYDEPFVMSLLEERGLRPMDRPRYGCWSGRDDGLSYQDIVVVERLPAAGPAVRP